MNFSDTFINEASEILCKLDTDKIESLVNHLIEVRQKGRLFVLGVGGSAGNASHMVNDLRKLCGIEAYAPTDNVPEITARTNDEGFPTIFDKYLETSKFNCNDAIFILSVGGGSVINNTSLNLINAIDYCKKVHGLVLGIVGKANGYTALQGDCVLVIPEVNPDRVTPHSEAFQALVWHCIVSHPNLQLNRTKW